jgi:hypothetical protein
MGEKAIWLRWGLIMLACVVLALAGFESNRRTAALETLLHQMEQQYAHILENHREIIRNQEEFLRIYHENNPRR